MAVRMPQGVAACARAWRRLCGRLALCGLLGALAACAGLPVPDHGARAPAAGLHPRWAAAPAAAPVRHADGQAMVVALAPVADARPGQPGRRLGSAEASVFGLHGRELVLADEATTIVDAFLREQLRLQGYTVVQPSQRADLRLDATLQALSLQVAARDARHVAVHASLRRQADGQLLWSGLLERQDDRFAGVTGNDRADLEAYLGEALADVATRLVLALRQPSSPPLAAVSPSAPPAAVAAVAPVPPVPAPQAPALGHVAISTAPARVRVYVDDVYHGLTPLTLELPAGVAQLHLKLEGWRSVSEKVAVRRGVTVELELKLQR